MTRIACSGLCATLLLALLGGCDFTSKDQPVRDAIVVRKNSSEHLSKPYVVLISIDGFRYDYAEKYGARNLLGIKNQGVWAEMLLPVFPSKTFPNHYSIVTGLYPIHHGLVSNEFYDRARSEYYRASNKSKVKDPTWYGGTPIWTLASKQGMVSACYFWVASEVPIQNHLPAYHYDYDGTVPNQERVDQVLKWLALPAEARPHFITLYFSSVDNAGHRYGPESDRVGEAVRTIDHLIGQLDEEISKMSLDVNLIVVSDHGMATIEEDHLIELPELVDLTDVEVTYSSPAMIYCEDTIRRNEIYQKLKGRDKNLRVYLRDEVPDYLKYRGDTNRIGDLVLMTRPPHMISSRSSTRSKGNHGYDPHTVSEMGGIFYAKGSAFQKGASLPVFSNIHLYPMMARILELEINEPIDGNLSVLKKLLVTSPNL